MVSRGEFHRISRLVDELDLPARFDLAQLIAAVEQRRQRRILCLPAADLDTGAEVCGLVICSPDTDLDIIFHATTLVAWHLEHTIAHEVGHLAGEHTQRASALPDTLADQVRPLLQTSYHNPLVGKMFGRYRFDSQEEREAELFASLVLAHRAEHADIDDPVADMFQPNRHRRHQG